jgi:hypothetical protein
VKSNKIRPKRRTGSFCWLEIGESKKKSDEKTNEFTAGKDIKR